MKKFSFIIFIVSLLIEVLYVTVNSADQVSQDACTHYQMASYSIEHGWYFFSNPDWIYYLYNSTPGWINHMIWIMSLGFGLKGVLYLNVLFNLGIGILLYKLADFFLNERVAAISLILFALYPTWIISPRIANSEIPYLFYMMLGMWLLFKDKWYWIMGAGVCIVMANWIRPFLPVLILFSVIILYSQHRFSWKPYAYLGVGIIIPILIIGGVTYRIVGHFEYQSLTQGVNMIMCAWDGATGGFTQEVFEKGNIGYIENASQVPYWEKNAFWVSQAFNWIYEHPVEWLSLLPKRIVMLYWSDTFYFVNYDKTCTIENIIESFPNESVYGWLFIVNHVYYYLLMLLSICGFIYGCIKRNMIIFLILLFVLASTAITVLAPGINRYHMVLMPFFIMVAAFYIDIKFCRIIRRKVKFYE